MAFTDEKWLAVIHMDCLKWWRHWTAGVTHGANTLTEAVAPAVLPRRMPSEYLALHTYLENRYAQTVVLTFDQMEALIGCALPPQARSDRGWWTAARMDTPAARHRDAWLLAHRTAAPNFVAGIVVFERVGG
jgi:hypothetical protein